MGSVTRDPDDEKRSYTNVYSNLKEDILVIASTLADVDREWACKFFSGQLGESTYDTYLNLAQLARALHGVEDFFCAFKFRRARVYTDEFQVHE